MSLWLGSGERSAAFAGSGVGLSLGLNLAEMRRVFAISEDGDGSENNSLEEADVKSFTGGEIPVQLPTSMPLRLGHVQSYQIQPNNLPKQVLSMRRLGDASVEAQFVADIPLQIVEANGTIQTKQQVWEKKRPNEGAEKNIAKLIEGNIGRAMNLLLQLSVTSTLKLPEPNVPL